MSRRALQTTPGHGPAESAVGIYDVMTPAAYICGAFMALLGVVGVWLVLAKSQAPAWLTVSVYSIPANCAISLFPHEPVLIYYGKTVTLWVLAAAASAGTVAAGFLDYRFFSPVLNLERTASRYRNRPLYRRAYRWFYRAPFLALVLAGFTPIPFFPFKIMAFASKYPLRRYLVALVVSRFPRYYLLALSGYVFQIPDWAIFATFLVMLAMIYHGALWRLRRMRGRAARSPGSPQAGGRLASASSPGRIARIAGRTIKSLLLNRPLCVSFEVTHNCTADCRHCDKGAAIDDGRISAAQYGRIAAELPTVLVQISGGEPLLRPDLAEIVRAVRGPHGVPMIAIVTNGSLLNEARYLELREAGVDQFSISIDFPDERHDAFRRIPGLFRHLDATIPCLLALGHNDIVLNCCIHRENYPHLPEIAQQVRAWGAKINFSTYTSLRTHDDTLDLRHPEDTQKLSAIIDRLYTRGDGFDNIMTSERVMRRYGRFHETHQVPGCRAGHRFLVVNPDGRLTPCAMHIATRYATRAELVARFARGNTCGGCYISSRANTEKPVWEMLADNLRFLSLSRRGARQGG